MACLVKSLMIEVKTASIYNTERMDNSDMMKDMTSIHIHVFYIFTYIYTVIFLHLFCDFCPKTLGRSFLTLRDYVISQFLQRVELE